MIYISDKITFSDAPYTYVSIRCSNNDFSAFVKNICPYDTAVPAVYLTYEAFFFEIPYAYWTTLVTTYYKWFIFI